MLKLSDSNYYPSTCLEKLSETTKQPQSVISQSVGSAMIRISNFSDRSQNRLLQPYLLSYEPSAPRHTD
jgi:hypothetical protein